MPLFFIISSRNVAHSLVRFLIRKEGRSFVVAQHISFFFSCALDVYQAKVFTNISHICNNPNNIILFFSPGLDLVLNVAIRKKVSQVAGPTLPWLLPPRAPTASEQRRQQRTGGREITPPSRTWRRLPLASRPSSRSRRASASWCGSCSRGWWSRAWPSCEGRCLRW